MDISSKQKKIIEYNPNGLSAAQSNLFGLPFDEAEADVIIIPAPWEVTVSYKSGTARAPKAIMAASKQVDLYDHDVVDAWKTGIFMKPVNKEISKLSKHLRKLAEEYILFLEEGGNVEEDGKMKDILNTINEAGKNFKDYVKREAAEIIANGKLPALLGGDHSTPLGLMEVLGEHHGDFGILQIDAHCDLRDAYEGFQFSHASIMFNALKISAVKKLVQVGIRDYCEDELNLINNSGGRIFTVFDHHIKRFMYEGNSWKMIVDDIVKSLPEKVYVSFDIDGLDPKLCPNTGTPVAGGLEFEQAVYLIKSVVDAGKIIIGFDLNEVSPGENEWDANVGARLLYKISNLMAASNKAEQEISLSKNKWLHPQNESAK